ncbi:ATP-dependent zinc metalloprotease FtsH [Humisphaera borealis]|uniref:ATP-dependent zinc metalloprotease FtsH n=1 Tax=Humisphaera borealis TaxID=2807512 RepID=A0A7M2WY99_9BACT|nr:ATP-dependent zinc metalloprotease FtsH [Humisphaera borealis]QOV90399.1 ATP-dependent zinc metalloprotease FtsH [Humisphaera borealis]
MAEQKPDRPNRKPGRPGPGNGNLKYRSGLVGWLLFIGLAVLLVMLVKSGNRSQVKIATGDFWNAFNADKVAVLKVESDEVSGKLKEKTTLTVDGQAVPVSEFRAEFPTGYMAQRGFGELLNAKTTTRIEVDNRDSFWLNFLLPFIPWLLIFGFIWFFVFRQIRSAGGANMLGNFGKSKARITSKEHTHVTFEDVAGVEEAKDEVMEIVEFLKNPKKFQRLGGRIPRGVLLVGEPGTGKTLLAKAIAGEADVPFFSISGSDFVEMFVGVGASRVRDLFKQAKDNSPCIVFLDEIDAVGRRRGSGFSSGGHDEREQTLNAILVEMDGFETNEQVIVCAATNRVDVLDPALTRPGRFDRQIYVPLPDIKGRMEILKVHSRKVKLGPNVDLMKLAKATPGFSGADLAAIINESALGATLAGKEFIEQDDMEEARDKVRFGRARKSRVIDEKEKLATAYHEAGHAVIQWVLRPDSDPIHKVTVIPRGNYGGATMSLPEKDRSNYSKKWCLATMKVLFGGRIAEEMFCGDVNTGVMSDIRQVTGLARKMVTEWGMNDRLGFVFYGDDDSKPNMFGGFGEGKAYSDETAKTIDEEVKKLIDFLYEEARQLLTTHKDRVDAMAKALVKYETLDASDVDRIMRGDNLNKPTISDLLDQQSRSGTVIQPGPTPSAPDVTPGFGAMPSPG